MTTQESARLRSPSPQWDRLQQEARFLHYQRAEQASRVASLLATLPRGRGTVLDVGARDAFLSAILTDFFESVTALDLRRPKFDFPRVVTVAGDARHLDFPDAHFDVVFCAEVLEHIPEVESACRELARVARHEVLVGVPNRQDTREGRTTCGTCGTHNPPYGHVNRFTADRLTTLFAGLRPVEQELVGEPGAVTNAFSAFVRDLAGNPDGTYDQEEPCINCGGRLVRPVTTIRRRVATVIANQVDRLQRPFVTPTPYWLHMLFRRT